MLRKCACRAFMCMFTKLTPGILRLDLCALLSFFSKCSMTYSIKSGGKTSSTGMSDMPEAKPTLGDFLLQIHGAESFSVIGAGAQCFFPCGSWHLEMHKK